MSFRIEMRLDTRGIQDIGDWNCITIKKFMYENSFPLLRGPYFERVQQFSYEYKRKK